MEKCAGGRGGGALGNSIGMEAVGKCIEMEAVWNNIEMEAVGNCIEMEAVWNSIGMETVGNCIEMEAVWNSIRMEAVGRRNTGEQAGKRGRKGKKEHGERRWK